MRQEATTQGPLRFAVFGNEYQAHKSAAAQQLLSLLAARGAEVCVEETFYRFLTERQGVTASVARVFRRLDFDVDFAVSLGGDGTLLRAASRVGSRRMPIVGVNTGHLGYLADVTPQELERSVEMLFAGEYATERHAVIELSVDGTVLGGCPQALNDIAVLKQDNASMIAIRATVDGELLTTYLADGLIVSTPTGSTAYSLSNGGPIIMPQTGVLCLTPVAPHSLNVRPIVVHDTAEIRLDVTSRSHKFLVAIDGRSEKLPEGASLTVRRAPYDVLIVKHPRHTYLSTLREKMMWGADKRGEA